MFFYVLSMDDQGHKIQCRKEQEKLVELWIELKVISKQLIPITDIYCSIIKLLLNKSSIWLTLDTITAVDWASLSVEIILASFSLSYAK